MRGDNLGNYKLLPKEGVKVEEVMNYKLDHSNVIAQIQMILRGVPMLTDSKYPNETAGSPSRCNIALIAPP